MSIDKKTEQLLEQLDQLCESWDTRAGDDDEKTMTLDEAIKKVGRIVDDFRLYNDGDE